MVSRMFTVQRLLVAALIYSDPVAYVEAQYADTMLCLLGRKFGANLYVGSVEYVHNDLL